MILDACCGPKEMYRGLHRKFSQDEIIFMDIRRGEFNRDKWGIPPLKVEPDIVADLKKLPFKDAVFNMIIFDPPHGSFNIESFLGVKYGGLSQKEFKLLVVWASVEFARVLKDGGVVFVKIMEVEDRYNIVERAFLNFKKLLVIKHKSRRAVKISKAITVWQLYVKKPVPTLVSPDGN